MGDEDLKKSAVTELPSIECTIDHTTLNDHNHTYIHIKGTDLDACQKHFDEILSNVH